VTPAYVTDDEALFKLKLGTYYIRLTVEGSSDRPRLHNVHHAGYATFRLSFFRILLEQKLIVNTHKDVYIPTKELIYEHVVWKNSQYIDFTKLISN